jgi:single-strand DNA-binding protein
MSLNKVMLIGNVGRDPEVRYLEGSGGAQNATKVASFTLATTERFRDRNGELRENTEWHNIVAWRNSADLAEKFIRKGSQIYIEGKLRTRSWTDPQGVKKYTTEVVVDNIQLLGKRGDGTAEGQEGFGPQRTQGYNAPQGGAYGAPAPGGFGPGAPVPAPQGYSQPAGFQPRPAAAPAPQPAPAIDIMGSEGSDDLPF